jgi:hypothetical protein
MASTWHDAARRGDFTELRRLLKVDKSLVCARDAQGRTVLHCLAALELNTPERERQAGDMLTTLLTFSGLDLDAANDAGHVPLHRACQSASRFALCLVAAGANVEARTARERRTPLELCRNAALRDELMAAADTAGAAKRKAVTQEAASLARRTSVINNSSAPAAVEHADTHREHREQHAQQQGVPAVQQPSAEPQLGAAPLPASQPELSGQAEAAPGNDADSRRRRLEQTPIDEAACAAWDRVANGLPDLDLGDVTPLVWRHSVPPALRQGLWCAAVGATPEVWATLAETHGISLAALQGGASPDDVQAIDAAVTDLVMRRLLRAAACVSGTFLPRSVPLGTLALFVCSGAEHSALLLLLALLRLTRGAQLDADAVALHIAKRRPDVVAALGPGGGGHSLDFMLTVSHTWHASPAREALVATLRHWLDAGFVGTARLEVLLRLWDVALLSNSQHPGELLACVAARAVAASADDVARAGRQLGREHAVGRLQAVRLTGDPSALLAELKATWAQVDSSPSERLEELAGWGGVATGPVVAAAPDQMAVAATHAQSLARAASDALDAALLARWAQGPKGSEALEALRGEAIKVGAVAQATLGDPSRFAHLPCALFEELARSKDRALAELSAWEEEVALKEPGSFFNRLAAAHQGDFGDVLDGSADKVKALVAVLDETLLW